ncbi:sugar ABC transporter permease [Phototrophicus methaneseepsis]|uniref:Sugar ABC transporter permease n=1 Tax=Phototrophicus methaneseepsis TaxID=2710758 RepID=A0A7S8E839_9CHLR|nr:sugar ABC transporter permease [Phototrophicus methaneseepsis]QPC82028.1 sugar ABC transporter permease [Phototrophicus methaneseepsis]
MRKAFPYLLLAPYLLFFILFLGYPILRGGYMSLFDWGIMGPKEFLGLGNYIDLFSDDRFWRVLGNSLLFTLLYVPPVIIISMLLAVLLHGFLPGISIFRSAFFLPMVINVSVSAIAIQWVMDPQIGLLNRFLDGVGLPTQTWLNQQGWAMLVVSMVVIWSSSGFNIIIFLAGLENISTEIYEAAEVDGSSTWHTFLHITVPLLRPVTLLVAVLSMISSLQVFGEIFMLTGGGPFGSTTVLAYYLYEQGFNNFKFGTAAAVGVVMTGIIALLTFIQFRFLGERNA